MAACGAGSCTTATAAQPSVTLASLTPNAVSVAFDVVPAQSVECMILVPIGLYAGSTLLVTFYLSGGPQILCQDATYPCAGQGSFLPESFVAINNVPYTYWLTIQAATLTLGAGDVVGTNPILSYVDSSNQGSGLIGLATVDAISVGGAPACYTMTTISNLRNTTTAPPIPTGCTAPFQAPGPDVTVSDPTASLVTFQIARAANSTCGTSAVLRLMSSAGTQVGAVSFTAAAGNPITQLQWWAGTATTPPTSATTETLTIPINVSPSAAQQMYLSFGKGGMSVGTGLNPTDVMAQISAFAPPFQAQVGRVAYAGAVTNSSSLYIAGVAAARSPVPWREDLQRYWWVGLIVAVAVVLCVLLLVAGFRHHPASPPTLPPPSSSVLLPPLPPSSTQVYL